MDIIKAEIEKKREDLNHNKTLEAMDDIDGYDDKCAVHMEAERQRMDQLMNKKGIDFFRSLINFKVTAGKSTRPTNFAGHIGRHMGSDLKRWFLDIYPNHSDYVKFFLKNDEHFVYDYMSGEVRLQIRDTRFVRPRRLQQLAVQCSDPTIARPVMESYVCELELFLQVFRELISGYEFSKTMELSVKRFTELMVNAGQSYDFLMENVRNLVADPTVDPEGFGTDLLKYLADNYKTMLSVDTKKRTVRIKKTVVETLKKVKSKLDDTVYDVLKNLVIKHLEANGDTDVDELRAQIAARHTTIVGHVFGYKPNDDYSFLDFVGSYQALFGYRREVTESGRALRLITLKPQPMESMAATPKTLDDIYFEDSDEERYSEDNEELDSFGDDVKASVNKINEELMAWMVSQLSVSDENVGKGRRATLTPPPEPVIDCCVHNDSIDNAGDQLMTGEEFRLSAAFEKRLATIGKPGVDSSAQTLSTGRVKTRLANSRKDGH